MVQNPAPSNIDAERSLDQHLQEMLEKEKKEFLSFERAMGRVHERIGCRVHERIGYIYGPLSKIWAIVDEERLELEEKQKQKEEEVDEDDEAINGVKQMCSLFEQSYMLLGQAFATVTHFRRHNILMAFIGNETKVKKILNEKTEGFLEKTGGKLFGPSFQKTMTEKLQSQQKSEELFKSLQDPKKKTDKPFPTGPLPNRRGRGRGLFSKFGHLSRAGNQFSSSSTNSRGRGRGKIYFKSFSNFPLSQQPGDITTKRIPQSTPIHKRVVQGKYSKSSSSRKNKILFAQLAKVNKRSSYTKFGSGIQNSLCLATKAVNPSKAFEFKHGRDVPSVRGNPRDVEKRGNRNGLTNKEAVSESTFSSKQERWWESSSNKSKKSEPIYSLCPLQNGRSVLSEGNVSKERSHVQNRSKGCVFLSSSSSRFTGICSVSMERTDFSVSLPLLRTCPSSQDVYQTHENSNHLIEEIECEDNCVFRRHASNGLITGGHSPSQGYINLHTSKIGVSNKCKKVSIKTHWQSGISEGDYRFSGNDPFPSSGKDRKDQNPMSESFREKQGLDKGIDASSRAHVINSNSSLASPSSISLFAETTNPINGEAEIIRSRDKFIPTGKTGNKLVDKQSSPSEWKISNIKPSTVDNKFRCFQRRMGSSLSKSTCRGGLDNTGETVTHKCLGIKGSNVSHQDIHSFKRRNNIYPYSNGQHDCPVLLGEDGRDTKSRINQGKQGDMGLFVGQTDHDYGRIFPRLL